MLSAIIPNKRGFPALLSKNNWYTIGLPSTGPLVLGLAFLNFTSAADRDQTVSRRSKPKSRNVLTSEQLDRRQLLHHPVVR